MLILFYGMRWIKYRLVTGCRVALLSPFRTSLCIDNSQICFCKIPNRNSLHRIIGLRLGVLDIMLVGRGQNEMANDPYLSNLQVKTIAEKCASKPLSIRGCFLKLFGGSAVD